MRLRGYAQFKSQKLRNDSKRDSLSSGSKHGIEYTLQSEMNQPPRRPVRADWCNWLTSDSINTLCIYIQYIYIYISIEGV